MLQIILFVVLSGVWLVEAGEFCYNSFLYCPYYCCGYSYCCSDCRLSVRSHPECYSYSSIAGIIGGIISALFFIIVIAIIISICCGCICSERTGIQRRGRVIRSGEGITVIHQPPGSVPPAPYGFVQQPGMYPQGKVIYPQGQPGINQTSYVYPPTQAGYQQSSAPPVYTVEPSHPPAYNPGFVPDHK